MFEFGDNLVEDVSVGGRELAVDGEEKLLGMGCGAVVEEPFEKDALMGSLLVDDQKPGGQDADNMAAHKLYAGRWGVGGGVDGGGVRLGDREFRLGW